MDVINKAEKFKIDTSKLIKMKTKIHICFNESTINKF